MSLPANPKAPPQSSGATRTSSLQARKIATLDSKFASLTEELGEWIAESAPGTSLEKHHSQILRIAAKMNEFKPEITQALQRVRQDGDAVLREARRVEQKILVAHRLWHFFRSKFALRKVPWMRKYLAAADDLAWACYKPACDLAIETGHVKDEDVREPPLLFFNGGWTPFILPRRWKYDAEALLKELREPDEASIFDSIVRSLPVSIIGLPWYQVAHLPEVVLVGHEVGHNVEDDLKLKPRLSKLVGDAMSGRNPPIPSDHQRAWSSWAGEVFADVYGNLAVGPAFTGVLMDFLAVDRSVVEGEEKVDGAWGEYPSTTLRVLINCQVLARCGFKAQAADLEKEWRTTYPVHSMVMFESDIPVVAKALLEGPYPEFGKGKVGLRKALSFTAEAQDSAEEQANNMIQKQYPTSTDVRRLFAAAALAFRKDPQAYQVNNIQEWVLDKIEQSREAGVRSGVRRHITEEELLQADKASAAQLYKRLWPQ